MLEWLIAALVAGSLAFSILVVIAARQYLARRALSAGTQPGISILKPVAGAEAGLRKNLESFFQQEYPQFEILFAAREMSDPAVAVIEDLQRRYPGIPTQLIVTGEPLYANAKVYSLERMTAAARFDLVAMSDSDIRVSPEFLQVIAMEFQDEGLDLATCPYRAVPGESLWSKLEAIGMNTAFLGGILTARMLEGMRFAVGPTIVARKKVIDGIGGWARVKDYLAEDFVLGQFAAEAGFGVELSRYVIEHHIGDSDVEENARHRLRWCRSTRRSRPAGYAGQLFTHPVPLALLLMAVAPAWWPLAAATLAARAAAAWATAGWVLGDPLCARHWWLIAAEDMAGFLFWILGFFGNTIRWRGRSYQLHRDGRFTPLR